MLRAAIFATLLAASAFAVARAQEQERPLVCRVAENTGAFEGQTLTLSGQLKSDFQHWSAITDEACPDTWVLLGRTGPGVEMAEDFSEAAWVSRVCPGDPLLFTVTGRIERQQIYWQDRLALTVTGVSDVRHAPGSQCPMTHEALRELNERYRASQQR